MLTVIVCIFLIGLLEVPGVLLITLIDSFNPGLMLTNGEWTDLGAVIVITTTIINLFFFSKWWKKYSNTDEYKAKAKERAEREEIRRKEVLERKALENEKRQQEIELRRLKTQELINNEIYNTGLQTVERKKMTKNLRKFILERDDYTCQVCGASLHNDFNLKLEVDHIVPISKGGKTDPSNLQTLCRKCNRSKGAKPMEVFVGGK